MQEPSPACAACNEIAAAEAGEDSWAIARLATGYVRLNPNQYFRGATFFAADRCVAELHELGSSRSYRHLVKMAEVAHAVFNAVDARKMNYEALGNSVAHLHWWLTPRHDNDPLPRVPIWQDPAFAEPPWGRWKPSLADRDGLRGLLLDALRLRDVAIAREFV